MIQRITIRNFKAIKELIVDFTPFTVLIGENSSGKSTVLQALDLLCSIASRDIDEYLKDRDWEFNDIKSQFSSDNDSIGFITDININGKRLVWDIAISNSNGKWLIEESIHDSATGEYYLSFGRDYSDLPFDFSQLNIKSSALKMLDADRNAINHTSFAPVLIEMKVFLTSSSSFELLSPDRMRSRGSRGKVSDIGMGGEKLAAFIHGMLPNKKNELNKMVSNLVGYDLKISTTAQRQPGWVEMFLVEMWGGTEVKTKKRYISDGLLRIIAFSAILVSQDNKKHVQLPFAQGFYSLKGFIMLDEIEDGINPIRAEKLMDCFKLLSKENRRQIVITSHSPVMLNYVDEGDILFMWRDRNGDIHARPLFHTYKMRETLEFLNPGEVWLNYPKESIVERLAATNREYYD